MMNLARKANFSSFASAWSRSQTCRFTQNNAIFSKKFATAGRPKKKEDPVVASELDSTIKGIESTFGKGAVIRLGSAMNQPNEAIPTGSLGLDLAMGIGGFPRGRIVEIFGPESSGKTTLALHVIAEAHKRGGKCTFIDAEHALDPTWAKKVGVDVDQLLVCQPDHGEQALEIADTLITGGSMDVIVVDSVAALVPKAELEGQIGDFIIGSQARLMSQALRKLTGSLGKNPRALLIFINQIRNKIGVSFGNPETTSGGNAMKFFTSTRIDIRRIGSVKTGESFSANQVRVKIVKNKVAPPFRSCTFDIDFTKGISKSGELVDLGLKAKLLEKSGSWYSFKGEQIAQGREKTKLYLEEHPSVAQELETLIREKITNYNDLFGDDVEEVEPKVE